MPYVTYSCTKATFSPISGAPVRWLDWASDFALVRCNWAATDAQLTYDDWLKAKADGYTYCGAVIDGVLASVAAVWRYSDAAWEVAAVRTLPQFRQQGLAKAVVSFVTHYILQSNRLATCHTAELNLPMRKTAEAVGFQPGLPSGQAHK